MPLDVQAKTPKANNSSHVQGKIMRDLNGRVRHTKLNAGHYLVGRFAQHHHDWHKAYRMMKILTEQDFVPFELSKREIVLAMGAGHADEALELARALHVENNKQEAHDNDTLIKVFLIIDLFQQKDYAQATQILEGFNDKGIDGFIAPFLRGWLAAAQGEVKIEGLNTNTLHLFHAILISDFLEEYAPIEAIIDHASKVEDITPYEQERIADLYGHTGFKEKALRVYEDIMRQNPENERVNEKIEMLRQDKNDALFDDIGSVEEGMARAFYDMAALLFKEGNDESARVFAHIALHLYPQTPQAAQLLAGVYAQHEHYDMAISYYSKIPKDHALYIAAQHHIADIYDKTDRKDQAFILLNELFETHKKVESLIKIGNLHRQHSDFARAVKAYDRAFAHIESPPSDEYWHLYFVRGIAYEQLDEWDKAEQDLKEALKRSPDQPYVLNYLGYSWADQGIHLHKALGMIKHAVKLRPNDGHITDSLGWALYRIEKYDEAVPILERAISLMPYDPTVNDHLGDAYWQVGRRREAQFQWERALNHSEDAEQIDAINVKIRSGLTH